MWKKIIGVLFSFLLVFVSGSLVNVYAACGDAYENHATFCSLVQIGGSTVPDSSYNCPNSAGPGSQCFIGQDLGSQPCNWTVDQQGLKFCFGGFSSQQELQSSTVQFNCTSNCGGPVADILSGNGSQSHSLAGAPVLQDSTGKYFSCIQPNGLDQSVIDAVNARVNSGTKACTVGGVAAGGVVTLLSGGLSLVGAVAVGGADIATVNECVNLANQYTPTIQTSVIKGNGTTACSRNISIKINATGEVTSTGNNVGAPGDSTHLFGPQVNITATCPNGGTGIQTAIGCIPIDSQTGLVGFFLKWGIGIGGGIAFLLIIFAGFQIMTSRGDPNRLKAGQELMTSAIAGLLLLIFSVIILRIIGVDILQITGF